MNIDLSKLPPHIKIEVTLDDLQRFANQIVEQVLKSKTETKEELLNISEVAALTQLSRATIYRLTSTRRIPFIKPGRSLLFRRSEIEQWLLGFRKKTLDELRAKLS